MGRTFSHLTLPLPNFKLIENSKMFEIWSHTALQLWIRWRKWICKPQTLNILNLQKRSNTSNMQPNWNSVFTLGCILLLILIWNVNWLHLIIFFWTHTFFGAFLYFSSMYYKDDSKALKNHNKWGRKCLVWHDNLTWSLFWKFFDSWQKSNFLGMLSAKFAMEVHVRMAESAILPNLYLEIYLYWQKWWCLGWLNRAYKYKNIVHQIK